MMDLYFESAGTIMTLINMGNTMEARAKGKTSDAITKLMDLAPKTATVERNGVESVIPIEEVQLGDMLIVKEGESVPGARGGGAGARAGGAGRAGADSFFTAFKFFRKRA